MVSMAAFAAAQAGPRWPKQAELVEGGQAQKVSAGLRAGMPIAMPYPVSLPAGANQQLFMQPTQPPPTQPPAQPPAHPPALLPTAQPLAQQAPINRERETLPWAAQPTQPMVNAEPVRIGDPTAQPTAKFPSRG